MIPELPEGISDSDLLDFYSKLAGNLSEQGSIHIRWWTHRQNPSVCWICDTNLLITKILDITNHYIAKSTEDIVTSSMSDNDSESEIENEPEYDVEDPQE